MTGAPKRRNPAVEVLFRVFLLSKTICWTDSKIEVKLWGKGMGMCYLVWSGEWTVFKTAFNYMKGNYAEDGNQLFTTTLGKWTGNVHKWACAAHPLCSASSPPARRISLRSRYHICPVLCLVIAETLPGPWDIWSSHCQATPLPPLKDLTWKFPSP